MKGLIVEDRFAEMLGAKLALADAGIDSCDFVGTLYDAELVMQQRDYDFVLTALLFPTGRDDLQLRQKYVQAFEDHQNRTYPTGPSETDMLYVMYQAMARKAGVSEQDALQQLVSTDYDLHEAPEMCALKENLEHAIEVYRFKVAQMFVEQGHLPAGVEVAHMAKHRDTPVAIVTAMNTDDQSYKAIEHMIDCPVVDTLRYDGKDWRRGLELVLRS